MESVSYEHSLNLNEFLRPKLSALDGRFSRSYERHVGKVIFYLLKYQRFVSVDSAIRAP
jgi:hypothetical protein